jgi:hypothetical protein
VKKTPVWRSGCTSQNLESQHRAEVLQTKPPEPEQKPCFKGANSSLLTTGSHKGDCWQTWQENDPTGISKIGKVCEKREWYI